ncbi:MAG: hypothetical protein E7485_00045 [Ruminococcaceae bacterium]|nr:hypothetical protein [Oscillospiraceae bacterium]
MQLRHFKCPSCGANLDVSTDSVEIKCDYCDQTFVVDTPKEDITETHQQRSLKLTIGVFIGVAVFISLITIAIILFSSISFNRIGDIYTMFSTMMTASAEIPLPY